MLFMDAPDTMLASVVKETYYRCDVCHETWLQPLTCGHNGDRVEYIVKNGWIETNRYDIGGWFVQGFRLNPVTGGQYVWLWNANENPHTVYTQSKK
jgi:hypothetical protein